MTVLPAISRQADIASSPVVTILRRISHQIYAKNTLRFARDAHKDFSQKPSLVVAENLLVLDVIGYSGALTRRPQEPIKSLHRSADFAISAQTLNHFHGAVHF